MRRSDFIVAAILGGVAWSIYSYIVAADFLVADEGIRRSEAPDWAIEVMILVAPVTTVLVVAGFAFRRWWIRGPALVAAMSLIALWIVARIELTSYS